MCLALFADIALVKTKNLGLIGWATGANPDVNIGWVIVAFVAFCGTVGIVVPVLLWFLKLGVLYLPASRNDYRVSVSGYVTRKTIQDEALTKESQFLLDYYRSESGALRHAQEERERYIDLLACLLLLAGINALFAFSDTTATAIIPALWLRMHPLLQCITVFVVLWAVGVVYSNWKNWESRLIYHPPLAKRKHKDTE